MNRDNDIASLNKRMAVVEDLLERIAEQLKPKDSLTRARFDTAMALERWQQTYEPSPR